jgi:hypothetical protein
VSTHDQTIAGDLASLAADNRIRLPALDATLRALTPIDVDAAPVADNVALLAAARVYVHRLARAASGAAASLCALALLVWLSNPLRVAAGSRIAGVLDHAVYAGPLEVASWIGLVVLATHLAVLRIAEHRVARLLARSPSDVLAHLRGRARSLARVATGLGVAGTASVVILLGLSWVSINLDRYSVFWDRDASGVLELMRHTMIAAVFGTLAVSASIGLVARSARLVSWLVHPAATASGVVLGAATVLVGLRLDVGPIFETFAAGIVPSTALRIVLTIAGTVAVLLVLASAALRRDRRETASLTDR